MRRLLPTWAWSTSLLRRCLRDERGVTTEQVIWLAGLAALAVAVLAIIRPGILAVATHFVATLQEGT